MFHQFETKFVNLSNFVTSSSPRFKFKLDICFSSVGIAAFHVMNTFSSHISIARSALFDKREDKYPKYTRIN